MTHHLELSSTDTYLMPQLETVFSVTTLPNSDPGAEGREGERQEGGDRDGKLEIIFERHSYIIPFLIVYSYLMGGGMYPTMAISHSDSLTSVG